MSPLFLVTIRPIVADDAFLCSRVELDPTLFQFIRTGFTGMVVFDSDFALSPVGFGILLASGAPESFPGTAERICRDDSRSAVRELARAFSFRRLPESMADGSS